MGSKDECDLEDISDLGDLDILEDKAEKLRDGLKYQMENGLKKLLEKIRTKA